MERVRSSLDRARCLSGNLSSPAAVPVFQLAFGLCNLRIDRTRFARHVDRNRQEERVHVHDNQLRDRCAETTLQS